MWASVNKSKGSTQKQTCLYNAECMNLPVCESSGSLESYVIMQTGKKKTKDSEAMCVWYQRFNNKAHTDDVITVY